MRHLHILVEGQTEEAIARNVIVPFFSSNESYVTLSVCPTRRPAGGPTFKGGVSTWAGGPEEVNDGVDTAPSKRLLKAYPRYLKSAYGPRVITDVGLPTIRAACPHADSWLTELEARILKGTGGEATR